MEKWQQMQDKWQAKWHKAQLGSAKVSSKKKFMMIFAYPGISGYLHVGHMRGFSYTDAICRLERMKGKEVLFPVGTHASGNHAFTFAKKVKNNDEKWVNYLLRNGCSQEQLKKLEDPQEIINYFNEVYVEEYWKKFGFLCDWDRFTSTVYPDYNKFIQWQFRKLQEQNLLVQKPYFATACVNCGPVAVDPSETDISKGGNAEKNEYTLLKFKLEGTETFLVAATLRPETIYGQTNLWINPDAQYVEVAVEGEQWIMSNAAAEKLAYQKDDVAVGKDVLVSELLGKKVQAPGIERSVPIYPATFIDAQVGSGVVTCVPSDAPYDYVALKTLQESKELCDKYGLNYDEVKSVELIPIITSKGFGDFPAKEVAQKLGIKSLDDSAKLEEATKQVYKSGFHSGVMRENAGEFAGMKVAQAKEAMKLKLLESSQADIFYDLSEEVICRCGAPVVIKRIDDQWFIRYSDEELTQKSKQHIASMAVYPKEYKDTLPATLDWFSDRACSRLGSWMGTTLPFDDKWTIEPISDSTLYPAYYIVSGYVARGELSAEDLNDSFFDYVYLGKGSEKELAEHFAGKWDTVKAVKAEFDYFYPLDINLGGKEHKTVHFPVFVMNHVGVLPQDKWPKGIFANWWVTGKGSKISKSKGGAEPIPDAIEKYGVDAMRLYYAHIGSPHVDVVWTEETVLHYKNALERIWSLFSDLAAITETKSTLIDSWLESEFHKSLVSIEKSLEGYNLRDLASQSYFAIPELFKWYLRRGGKNKKLLAELSGQWVKLLCPITPHLAEELAEQYALRNDSEDFVSSSLWPEADRSKISEAATAQEDLVKMSIEGMRGVLKLAKLEGKAKQFTLFVSQPWRYDLFRIVKQEMARTRNMGEIIKAVLSHKELAVHGKEISKIIAGLLKNPSRLPTVVSTQDAEHRVLVSAKAFLEAEMGCPVAIVVAAESDHPKAASAMPGKVGILVE